MKRYDKTFKVEQHGEQLTCTLTFDDGKQQAFSYSATLQPYLTPIGNRYSWRVVLPESSDTGASQELYSGGDRQYPGWVLRGAITAAQQILDQLVDGELRRRQMTRNATSQLETFVALLDTTTMYKPGGNWQDIFEEFDRDGWGNETLSAPDTEETDAQP